MTSSKNRHITDELLSAYLDDAVSDQERQLIERAVASDNDVAWRLESLRQTVALLSTLPELSLPRSFVLSPEHLQAGGNTVASHPTPRAAPVSRPAASATGRDTTALKAGMWEEFLAGWRELWQGGNVALRNAAAVSLVLMLALFGGSAYLGTNAREMQVASAPAASESAAESVAVAPTAPAQTDLAAGDAESSAEEIEEAAPAQAPAAADARTANDETDAEAAQEPVEQPPATAASVAAEADSEQPVTEQPVTEEPVTGQDAEPDAAASPSTPQGFDPTGEAPQAQAAMTAPDMPRMEDVPPGIIIPGASGPEGMPVDPGASGGIGGAGGDMGGGMETMPGVAPNARMFPPQAYEPLPTPLPTETPSTQTAVTDSEIYSDTVAPPAVDASVAAAEVSTVAATQESVAIETPASATPITATPDIATPDEVALVRPSPLPTATVRADEAAAARVAEATTEATAETAAETAAENPALPVLAIAQAASVLITLMLASLWWRSRRHER